MSDERMSSKKTLSSITFNKIANRWLEHPAQDSHTLVCTPYVRQPLSLPPSDLPIALSVTPHHKKPRRLLPRRLCVTALGSRGVSLVNIFADAVNV